MNKLEKVARGTVIAALGAGAGWISLSHVYRFVMRHSAPGTHWSTGVIVAAVSELMPIGVALHARATGKLGLFAKFLLVLAGCFSLWAQIATADLSVTGCAVAAFPTLAFMGLVKLMLAKDETSAPTEVVPENVTSGPQRLKPMTDDKGAAVEASVPSLAPKAGASKSRRPRHPGGASSRAATAERVRAARLELGEKATQGQVGARAGCSAATVSRIENPKDGRTDAQPTVRVMPAQTASQV